MTTSLRSAAWVAALLVGTAACTADDDALPPGSSPIAAARATEVACPEDITRVVVATPTCTTVTVLEGGADPDRTVSLFVTRIPPAGGVEHEDPVVVVGTELATVPNYGGIAPLADRVRREVIVLDPRGVGHSRPALDCPEVDALSASVIGAATDDEQVRASWTAAVAACHDRLVAQPVDPAAYTQEAMAKDVVQVVRALDLPSWNLVSYGTAGRVALAVLPLDPPGLRSMVLDSPELPTDDARSFALPRTQQAVEAVLELCRAEADCDRTFRLGTKAVVHAVRSLDRDPVVRTIDLSSGSTDVRYDGALLVRLLRYFVGGSASAGPEFTPSGVPALLRTVLDGKLARLDTRVAGQIAGDQPYCLGYFAHCEANHRLSLGVYLSHVCGDLPSYTAPARRQRKAFGVALESGPYADVCRAWPVPPPSQPPADVGASDVPVLVAVGALNPFIDPEGLRRGLAPLTRLQFLVHPTAGHNIVGSQACVADARTAWLDNLAMEVADACADAPPPDFYPSIE